MDLYGSPYITHYSRFQFLFHSFIPRYPKARLGVSGFRDPPSQAAQRMPMRCQNAIYVFRI